MDQLANIPVWFITGLIVGGAAIGGGIAAKLNIGKNGSNGNGKWDGQDRRQENGYVSAEVCGLKHDGLDKRLDSGKQAMTDLCTDIKGLRQDFQGMKLEISNFIAVHEATKSVINSPN